MTVKDLLNMLSDNQYIILGYFLMLLISTIILAAIVKKTNFSYLKYVASILVYGACIPGIFATMVTCYLFFIAKADLLHLNVTVYFLPIVFMVIILLIMNRRIGMKSIPGFGRLSALMLIIGLSFLILFIIQRTYFGVVFMGGFVQLLVAFAILFFILKYAWSKLVR
ncbi:hypothetical protein GCM10011506_19400 [Marivirga lumbricoides]|uniref:Uncharacterized protein n=1 Tax=Marivirga lumbricoides TaxID=1046115 RepID=A0ABQ1MA22_9BACT|nr:hypothetical protein GCM10011506_19400 [Marivirga lumbricoides]